jgi:hypothetical protein
MTYKFPIVNLEHYFHCKLFSNLDFTYAFSQNVCFIVVALSELDSCD